jgi:drug/metabolite transporter (DMT)-like permease
MIPKNTVQTSMSRIGTVSKRGWLLFISLGIIWGTPYLFIRIAVEDFSPAIVVFGRVMIAALLLLPIAIHRGHASSLKTHWKGILAFAIIEMCLPFGALAVAEKEISSSLTGLLIAAVPIVNAIISRQIGLDSNWDARRIIGLLIGITGVGLLVGFDISAANYWAIAICFIAVLGYALGPIIITKLLSDVESIGVISWSLLVAGLIYLPLVIRDIVNNSWRAPGVSEISTSAIVSIIALGVLCSAIAFVVLFELIDEVGPTRTTVITYINPAVAIILGVVLLSEPLTLGIMIGFPVVLIGSVMATRKNAQPREVIASAER